MKNVAGNQRARASVSAEVFGRYHVKEQFVPIVVPKSDEVKQKLQEILTLTFIFGKLKQQEKSIIIDAMENKNFEAGETVIKQNDAGDVLFVVEEGELDCFKEFVSHNHIT